MLNKKMFLTMAASTILLLSACSDASAKDEIYNHLEEAVALEETFEAQQEPIIELEKQEQKLYDQIIDLGMDEFDKIKKLSQEAITIIDERSDKIKVEKESIDQSKEEFKKIQDLIEKLEQEEVTNKASEMYDIMMNRYEAYSNLYNNYSESLTLEKELYELLQKEDAEEDELTDKIATINESYEKVMKANENFNTETAAYNELKKEFYEAAGIDAEFEEEKPPAEAKESE